MNNLSELHVSTVDAISQFLFMEDEPRRADLAFVFGSNWLPTMDPAIDLFHKGLVSRIMVSGAAYSGTVREKTECEVFCEYALSQGVPEHVLLREQKATNTLENMLLASKIIEQEIGWETIQDVIFICKTFHTRRVLMTASKHWPRHLSYYFLPVVDERAICRDNWWQDSTARIRVLEEVKRIAEYTLKGDIGDF